jgi:hypothetical protein
MRSTLYLVPGFIAGAALLGGATAYAFGGDFNADMFSSFSAEERSAIEEAFTIRKHADEQARAVLDAAGVDESALRDAMKSYRDERRAVIEAALTANDYDAFKAAVADAPFADQVTKDTFKIFVEAYNDAKEGHYEDARTLLEDNNIHLPLPGLRDGPEGHGPHHG